MVTEHATSELERTASWPSVRAGLTLLVVTWLVATVLGTAVQLAAMQLDPALRVSEPGAVGILALSSLVYQLLYGFIATLIVVSAVKLTRTPPTTGVITPALVAAASYVLVLLVNTVLLVSSFGGEAARTGDLTRQLTVLLTAARATGVIALLLALVRLGRSTSSTRPSAIVGTSFALAAIDTGYPLYRALVQFTAPGPQSVTERGLLLTVQVLLAFTLIDLALAARRGVKEACLRAPVERSAPEAPAAGAAPESEPARGPTRARTRPVEASPTLVWTAAVLGALGVVLLPGWDAFSAASSVAEIAGVDADGQVVSRPLAPVAYGVLAILVLVALLRLLRTGPYFARLVWLGATAIALHYAVVTAMELAQARSRLVDEWVVCETGLDVRGNLPSQGPGYAGPYDGPRTSSGQPCIKAAERRDIHAETEPRGGFQDGLVQIGIRFPVERRRVLYGSIVALLALGISGWLTARAGAEVIVPAGAATQDEAPKTRTARRRRKR